ncbi:MAG: helicase-exonuclease AddAB subunit AddA [Oscillospiraceae bacterium]|nr:helicase-exonuclease AddAB subunit AddA [Oscillospiraceae bacterium]
MADTLTKAQALAVERPGGPILVAAAAGSGKTKVIVERLMRQILRSDRAVSINDFLIITFTKKAAAELRARIARELAARLAEDPDNRHLQKQQSRIYMTQISTVHAFCAELLREFAYELDIPADFRMLEQTEAAALREKLVDELLEERYASIGEDPALRQLVDGLGAGRDDRRLPGLILSVFNTAQCNLNPAGWLEECEARLDQRGVTGAEQTPWGLWLLAGLRDCAREQARALERVGQELEGCDSLAKYRPLFGQNAAQLRRLADCESWDETLAAIPAATDFGRLPVVKSCEDPELQERAKAVRKQALELLRRRCEDLYGPSETVLADLAQSAETLGALFALAREFAARFEAEKRRLHALDFGDLEHQALRLLLEPDGRTPTPTARRISERYREIMVDEYQDTNQVQDAIFRAVSREGANRFMVGDVKQSIYRFRLADPGIFLEKYGAYPDAEQADPAGRQRILLSHNFRSGEAVLEAVNAVFRSCMSTRVGGLDYGPAEALRPGRPMEPLPQTQVELHVLSTRQEDEDAETPEKDRAEAEFAARRIRELLDSRTLIRGKEGLRPAEPGDVVILLRSPKNVAEFYLEALQRRGVPAASDSGESLLDSAEVQALLCLLKVLDNAHQDIPLTGALLSPIFGVEASALARVRRPQRGESLFDAAAESEEPSLVRAISVIRQLRELVPLLPLHLLLEKLQQAVELEAVYGAMDRGPARLENLRAFYELAAAFSEGGKKSLHQLLAHVEELKAEGGVTLAGPQSNAVTVMSVHKSKGLEFPVVLLCGLSHRFNLEDQKALVQFHSALGAGCSVYDRPTHTRFSSIAKAAISRQTGAENMSEELRILYVAMTRARDMLILCDCGSRQESRLAGLAACLTPETAPGQAARAVCPGDWVLLTALLRTEAGALHARAGKPAGTSRSEWPWRIEWHDLPEKEAELPAPAPSEAAAPTLDAGALAESLAFCYPWGGALGVPSKLTATQLKGRELDREADDGAPREDYLRLKLRKPSLIRQEKPLTPAQRGSAVHQAMQYLDFSRTADLEQIRAQLEHMVREAFLTPAQARAVDPEKLLRVFRGPLGERIRAADRVLREFKFSILSPAERYYPAAAGEEILLQGVTDCCLFRNGSISVVDFKTDRVQPGTEAAAGERYRPQLEAYAEALARIFGCPVGEKLLYFFATDTLIALPEQRQKQGETT